MIVLDTNVLSELMRTEAVPPVRKWLAQVEPDDLYTTSVCEAEILMGLAIMPSGRKKSAMEVAAYRMFAEDFGDRILPFDSEAARSYAEIVAVRRRRGSPVQALDAMIASIARVHDAAVATRNLKHFEGCGLVLHDPWAG